MACLYCDGVVLEDKPTLFWDTTLKKPCIAPAIVHGQRVPAVPDSCTNLEGPLKSATKSTTGAAYLHTIGRASIRELRTDGKLHGLPRNDGEEPTKEHENQKTAHFRQGLQETKHAFVFWPQLKNEKASPGANSRKPFMETLCSTPSLLVGFSKSQQPDAKGWLCGISQEQQAALFQGLRKWNCFCRLLRAWSSWQWQRRPWLDAALQGRKHEQVT